MLGDEFDGRTCAYEKGRMLRETGKELLRQADGRGGNGNRVGADFGLRAHFLGDRERMLEQRAELRAQRAGLLSIAHGIFQLAEDLRFAEYHGIQAASDPEYVPNRFLVIQREQAVRESRVEVAFIM